MICPRCKSSIITGYCNCEDGDYGDDDDDNSSFKLDEPFCPECGSDDILCEKECTYHECVSCGHTEGKR